MDTQSKRINRIGKIGWEKHMIAWRSSGLTQAAYCRQHDLNPRYFSVWCHLACKTGPLLTKIAWKIDPPILLNFGFQLPRDNLGVTHGNRNENSSTHIG